MSITLNKAAWAALFFIRSYFGAGKYIDMSLVWVVVGTFAQLCFAFFLFMLAAFAGGGYANGNSLKPMQLAILNLSLYLLPALCVISAGIVIALYRHDAGAGSYLWYCLPIIGTVIYFTYTNNLTRK